MLTEKLNRKDNSIGLLFNDPTFLPKSECDNSKCCNLIGGFESAS